MLGLILRSIRHYRWTHAVILLAVAISTAVIGGALIVGDSVRGSLRQMTLDRLGRITHVLHSPRFVREQLATELNQRIAPLSAAPALLLTASVEHATRSGQLRRASSVTLLGLRPDDWSLMLTEPDPQAGQTVNWKLLLPEALGITSTAGRRDSTGGSVAAPSPAGVVLGARTAAELGVSKGDSVTVWVERPSAIPRDSLLGERDEVALDLILTVDAVLPETAGASRFSLHPAQQLPRNAFVALSTLQQRLGLDARAATRRTPLARPARVNTMLIAPPRNAVGPAGSGSSHPPEPARPFAAAGLRSASRLRDLLAQDASQTVELRRQLQRTLTAADLGLRLRPITPAGFLSVESDSLILEDAIARAVEQSASELGLAAAPTLVYLINELNAANRSDDNSQFSMYSIAAGLDFHQPEPLGPFRLADGSPVPELAENEILLSDWVATDLQVQPGDTVQARWHEVGSHGDLPEIHHSFVVRGILPADDRVSVNPDLTPFVEGVTNVNTFAEWDQPFEMQLDRITDRDDAWWEAHRAAPKSFVSLATARKLWSSRFGRATSIRIASPGAVLAKDRLETIANRLAADVPGRIAPEELGLLIRPVRAEGLQASMGANDFSQLFLGFSGFLILSALLLAALMFQLNVRTRVRQLGLLTAVGFTRRRVRWLFTAEGLIVALGGAVGGAVASAYCAQLLILALTTWWSGAVGTQFLRLELQPLRLVIAAGTSLILAAVVLSVAVRSASRASPRELLAGRTSADQPAIPAAWRDVVMTCLLVLSGLTAAGLPGAVFAGVLPSGEAFAGLTWQVVGFFVAGLACLTSGLLLLRLILARRTRDGVESGIRRLSGLAVANAARNQPRSLLTTALMAFATFVIVAVAAGRRNPVSELPDRNSGNGGFTLVGESSLPVLFDMNSADGRQRLGINASPATTIPGSTRVFGFRVKPGQDASCLNLFQATVPTLLGATPEFIRRGGFRFAGTPGENPWTQLEGVLPDLPLTMIPVPAATPPGGTADWTEDDKPPAATSSPVVPAIPVIGDMNTLQFSLKKTVGDVILIPDNQRPQFALKVVGMLDSSIFQGVLVMSEASLLRVDPTISGYRYFLIETAGEPGSVDQTATALETALQSSGFDTEPVSRRLADFLAVQNTYLSTFQMLGALGLLMGTFGLAVVMLRNVLERRAEIALLRSLGFRNSRLARLILLENGLLLLWGLLTGCVAALLAMSPHLISTGADVPWSGLVMTLVIVAIVGMFAAVLPIRASWRVPIRDVLSQG